MNDTPTDLDFACNGCGGCCRDLRIPLTIDEATAWLQRGGHVELLCDAMPWLVEPEPDNAFAAYKRARSTAALSGSLPVRVTVMLTASHAGPCPNLRDDLRCAIYDERPLVCRIYPAEVNPFVPLAPAGKQCSPDAWQQTPFVRGGTIVDAATHENIARSRAAWRNLCCPPSTSLWPPTQTQSIAPLPAAKIQPSMAASPARPASDG